MRAGYAWCNLHKRRFVTLFIVIVVMMIVIPAGAQTFTVIHSFSGADGSQPYAGLTMDRAGNFYGTTFVGGAHSDGLVYRLARSGSSWILTPLYNFAGQGVGDGALPSARVVFGPDGALYGTTSYGGTSQNCFKVAGCGTVFRLTPPAGICHAVMCPWIETQIHSFAGEGELPGYGDVVFDHAGNLYGTTAEGGTGQCGDFFACGVVYELSHSGGFWTENTVYQFGNFQQDIGVLPYAGVIVDQAGNLYGTTSETNGSVYELMPGGGGWSISSLHTFATELVYAGLISDAAGNLYGATADDGSGTGGGQVFELSPSGGGWTFNTLYSFSYSGPLAAPGPLSNLTMDAAGNLYGTTYAEGASDCGSVFKLTHTNGSGNFSSLHDFTCGSDGGSPIGGVTLDSAGNLWGTASAGGAHSQGVVWEITP